MSSVAITPVFRAMNWTKYRSCMALSARVSAFSWPWFQGSGIMRLSKASTMHTKNFLAEGWELLISWRQVGEFVHED
jgi:hypothetical protein